MMLYKWVSRGWRAGSVAKSTRFAEDLSWFPAPTLDSCKCHIHLSRASQTRHSCSQIQTGVCIGRAILGHAFMLFPKRVVANTCPTPSSKLVTRWEWGSELESTSKYYRGNWCVRVCVLTCGRSALHGCSHVYGDQSPTSKWPSTVALRLVFGGKGLFPFLTLLPFSRLAHQETPGIHLPPTPSHQDHEHSLRTELKRSQPASQSQEAIETGTGRWVNQHTN